ncbi:uncharacterized protein TNCV_487061 [Trichonephila clavipes]|nr:uncharacterized protein TNCV_487061 [Trichonephila clavipes]
MDLSDYLPQINLGVQGRALDWFEVLGYRVVEDKVTDYAHLKQALTEQFPVVRYRSELETRINASSQKHNQKLSGVVYDLLKIHKILKLEMAEEKLLDHVINQPGLTHVLYHEIDTGDKGPVVSRPYRYDRVKQGIIEYHIKKMLQEGTIRPIQSPYAPPVVLTRKNNGLLPDSPDAYRFAIDYRKLNAITKYPRYPLPSIAGPTHPIDTRQSKPSTEGSRQGASVQYDRAWETRTTPSGGNSAVERRPVQSRQATAVRPCPYYLRSRVKQPEGIPEEQRSNGIDGIPQNNLRRSLSMEALDGEQVDRSE